MNGRGGSNFGLYKILVGFSLKLNFCTVGSYVYSGIIMIKR